MLKVTKSHNPKQHKSFYSNVILTNPRDVTPFNFLHSVSREIKQNAKVIMTNKLLLFSV